MCVGFELIMQNGVDMKGVSWKSDWDWEYGNEREDDQEVEDWGEG